jgi:methionyl-tRNA formyltransferase
MHFSLLPRWRGAAPVERAILAGDAETGVCLMEIEAGLDTGPVFATRHVVIGPNETAGELHARLVDVGTELLLEHLPRLASARPDPQTGEATYADKLTVEEFRLHAEKSAQELVRIVRAGNPRPGAWFTVGGRRVKVWRAHEAEGSVEPATIDAQGLLGTATGALALDEVQPEGKKPMTARAWIAGVRGGVRLDRS